MKSVLDKRTNICARVLGWALFATVAAAPAAEATPIVINAGASLAGNTAALAAFNRAATTLGGLFSDSITVNINANLAPSRPESSARPVRRSFSEATPPSATRWCSTRAMKPTMRSWQPCRPRVSFLRRAGGVQF